MLSVEFAALREVDLGQMEFEVRCILGLHVMVLWLHMLIFAARCTIFLYVTTFHSYSHLVIYFNFLGVRELESTLRK